MTKERRLLKKLFLLTAAVTAVYFIAMAVTGIVCDNTLTERHAHFAGYDVSELSFEVDPPELMSVKSAAREDGGFVWTLEPGTGEGIAVISTYAGGELVEENTFRLSPRGVIIDTETGNFSNYRVRQLGMTLFTIAFAVLLWAGFAMSVKELRYSYQSVFCSGLGLCVTLIAALMTEQYIKGSDMLTLYRLMERAPQIFFTRTFPFIAFFAVLLIISNVKLILHEGFRVANALGIVLSFAMVGGFFLLTFVDRLAPSGSGVGDDAWSVITSLLDSVYALLECFLVGAIICGLRAALSKAEFDKDYIIILGCRVRKDGTLYPLIKGRVDRAIRFYNEQLAATGKKAVFIPSGGKGTDETLSEGAAMKRYLLEQGFEENQIIAETNSVNTKENMKFSKRLMEAGKKAVFATTNYHVFRSGIIAGQQQLDAEGIGAKTVWYFWPNAYVRETIGMISYKWKTLAVSLIPTICFLCMVRYLF